jgi:hypothetical protein
VPRDAVAAIPVEVEADRVEFALVASREDRSDLLEDGRLERFARLEAPRSRQPWFLHALVVHPAGSLLPVPTGEDLAE